MRISKDKYYKDMAKALFKEYCAVLRERQKRKKREKSI